jgi:hypothetical protein
MNTSAYIQDTNEDIRIDYQHHHGQGTGNSAQQYTLHENATMKLLQRGHQLVNERISPTSGMGWTSCNDLKESGHTNEVQHIQRENKESGIDQIRDGQHTSIRNTASTKETPRKDKSCTKSTCDRHDYSSGINTFPTSPYGKTTWKLEVE